MKRVLLGLTGFSALIAFSGGLALAILRVWVPDSEAGTRLWPAYQILLWGFGVAALCGSAYAVIGRRATEASPPPPSLKTDTGPQPAAESDAATLFRQVRTHIDLEMWELALDKANTLLSRFPDSREAQTVSRTINEIRWKAEPKFVARSAAGVTETEERRLHAKGLEQMLNHVRTYMELEMWELAKQKAVAILQNFPDSSEATQVVPLYQEIEKKLQERAPQPVPDKKE